MLNGLMKRTSWVVFLALFSQTAAPRLAEGKAHHCPTDQPITVEAVVTQVDMTDNPGDTDYNFYLRPLAPSEESAFPNVKNKTSLLDAHWNSECSSKWAESLIRALNGIRERGSSFSGMCKQESKNDFGCPALLNDGPGVPANPCPLFLKSPACLYDLHRLTDGSDPDNLSNFTPKAEIFIGDNRTCTSNTAMCNEQNLFLETAMRDLGVSGGNCGRAGIAGIENLCVYCTEYAWDGSTWYKPHQPAGSICGKRVLVTGFRTFDDSHDMRPEIHPLSGIVVENGEGRFRAGHFIDGSTNPKYDPTLLALTALAASAAGAVGAGLIDGVLSLFGIPPVASPLA